MNFSQTQVNAIRLARDQEKLVRRAGGFWSGPSVPTVQRDGYDVPEWYCSIGTIRALEKLGVLERCNDFPEEWRDSRRLKAGRS